MRARVITNHTSHTVVTLLAIVTAGLVGSYMYLVAQSIVNAALAKEMEQDIASIATRIGGLEFEYIEIKESIGRERAGALGFTAVSEKFFATRKALNAGLSLLRAEE